MRTAWGCERTGANGALHAGIRLAIPLQFLYGALVNSSEEHSADVSRRDLCCKEGSESVRLTDLETTIELLVEAHANVDGARERVAIRNTIQKSVITDRVRRTEEFFAAALFGGPQRKTPTRAGKFVARRGPQLLAEIVYFGELVRQEAEEK